MSDQRASEPPPILDLDHYPKKKAILLGAAVTLLLSFVQYSWLFFCFHLAVGGLAAAGYFAKSHQISFSFWTGAKMGALASMLGVFVFYLAAPLRVLSTLSNEQWDEFKGPLIEQFYQNGQPALATELEKMAYADIRVALLIAILALMLGLAAVGGVLGGGLGALFFKRGPEAR